MSLDKKHIDLLNKLANGKISNQEKWELERASLEDPFLADAIEGFYNQKEEGNTIVLKTQKTGGTKFRFLKPLSIAASFMLLLTATWLILDPNDSQLDSVAMKQESLPTSVDYKEDFDELVIGDANEKEFEEGSYLENSNQTPQTINDKAPTSRKTKAREAKSFEKKESVSKNVIAEAEPVFDQADAEYEVAEEKVSEVELIASAEAIESISPKLVKGNVLDEEGNPLIGVTIETKDKVVNSNQEGKFEIALEDMDDDLIFSFAGYESEIVKAEAVLTVELKQSQEILSNAIKSKAIFMSEQEVIDEYKEKMNSIFDKQYQLCYAFQKKEQRNQSHIGANRFSISVSINEFGIPFIIGDDSELEFNCTSEIQEILDQLQKDGVFYDGKPVEFDYELKLR